MDEFEPTFDDFRFVEPATSEPEPQRPDGTAADRIGELTGAIADDFGDLLTTILGFGDLASTSAGDESQLAASLDHIKSAGQRARSLTRQLLALGRSDQARPLPTDLNAVVADLEPLLRRIVGDEARMQIVLGPALATVVVDPGHLAQMLVSLAFAARETTANGGALIVQTENTRPPAALQERPSRVEQWVSVTVREIVREIFAPSRRTPEQARGLRAQSAEHGLARAYDLIAHNGGHIDVDVQPDLGRTLTLYLPAIARVADLAPSSRRTPVGQATILVIEDEPSVRELLETLLTRDGHLVLVPRSRREALGAAEWHGGSIDLVITDSSMAGDETSTLVEELLVHRPGAPVLYISGLVAPPLLDATSIAANRVLQKPFTPDELRRAVHTCLDSMTIQPVEGTAPAERWRRPANEDVEGLDAFFREVGFDQPQPAGPKADPLPPAATGVMMSDLGVDDLEDLFEPRADVSETFAASGAWPSVPAAPPEGRPNAALTSSVQDPCASSMDDHDDDPLNLLSVEHLDPRFFVPATEAPSQADTAATAPVDDVSAPTGDVVLHLAPSESDDVETPLAAAVELTPGCDANRLFMADLEETAWASGEPAAGGVSQPVAPFDEWLGETALVPSAVAYEPAPAAELRIEHEPEPIAEFPTELELETIAEPRIAQEPELEPEPVPEQRVSQAPEPTPAPASVEREDEPPAARPRVRYPVVPASEAPTSADLVALMRSLVSNFETLAHRWDEAEEAMRQGTQFDSIDFEEPDDANRLK